MKQWQEPKFYTLGIEKTFGGDDGTTGDGDIFQVTLPNGKTGKMMGLNSGLPWADNGGKKVN